MASVDRPITTILMIIVTLAASTAANSTASFYDVLQSNGLPMGLFPKGISGFSLDPLTGLFELYMLYSSPCDAKFETPVRYQCNITGRLNYGSISDLNGVAAHDLFLWLPVKSILVDIPRSSLIYFDAGVVFKQFSLSFFETPRIVMLWRRTAERMMWWYYLRTAVQLRLLRIYAGSLRENHSRMMREEEQFLELRHKGVDTVMHSMSVVLNDFWFLLISGLQIYRISWLRGFEL